jgi:hypothetical protein
MEATGHIGDALLRIRTEYIEMPDLKLTGRQAQRLWSLSGEVWEAALAILIGNRFLAQTRDGAYVRHSTLRSWSEPAPPAGAPGIGGVPDVPGGIDALLRAS